MNGRHCGWAGRDRRPSTIFGISQLCYNNFEQDILVIVFRNKNLKLPEIKNCLPSCNILSIPTIIFNKVKPISLENLNNDIKIN